MKIKEPWREVYYNIIHRCSNPKATLYRLYGGRGIKCLISRDEIKFLWVRDNASEMKDPTINRINPDGNYELSNCEFIERSENSRQVRHFEIKDEFSYIKHPQIKYGLRNNKKGLCKKCIRPLATKRLCEVHRGK